MGKLDTSTTRTTVTATSTIVVPGQGTTTSTLVSLTLLPTPTTSPGSSLSNGAVWDKYHVDIVSAIVTGIVIQLVTLYCCSWW